MSAIMALLVMGQYLLVYARFSRQACHLFLLRVTDLAVPQPAPLQTLLEKRFDTPAVIGPQLGRRSLETRIDQLG